MKLPAAIAMLMVVPGCLVAADGVKEPVDYVDPNIGGIGYMLVPALPNVQLPHGLARLAPVTPTGVKDRYLADQVYGFRAGASVIMPFVGKLETEPERFAQVYDHDQETVTPYSYSALLEDSGILVEYTVSHSVAYYRFTFPERGEPRVLFSLAKNGQVKVLPPNAMEGAEETTRSGGRMYFHAEFERPFSGSRTWTEGSGTGAVAEPGGGRRVDIKIGFSYISADQARQNIAREIPHWDFDRVKSEARAIWNRELGKIEIRGGDEEQRTIFYTALYRAMGRPNNLVEGDRYYSGADQKVHPAGGHGFYSVNNLWGSYRPLHLQLLLDPERQLDYARSYLRVYEQSGWMQGYTRPGMIGQHQTAFLADLYGKGYRDFDVAKAYEGLRKNRMESTMLPWRRGPLTALDRAYQEKGYVPALGPGEKETVAEVDGFERRQSVGVTLEAAYDDWCLAQLAQALGKVDDAALFLKRARNYVNVFDTRSGFMRPKTADGRWIEPFSPTWSGGQGGRDYFTEMNSWIYTWHVQQDVAGLIRLMGGKDRFLARLDQLFREQYSGFQEGQKFVFLRQFPDQTGLIGQYAHGNEPSFHIPYLYNYAGQPWKTQRKIRQILKVWYHAQPLGYAGDEDDGELSSWYVLSAMGFYPVCPGRPVYDIGTPLFDEVKLHLAGGKLFTITANHVSAANKYIQAARLNGRPLDKAWFDHKDLAGGGSLVFEMGPRPNLQWGSAPAAAPPSMTQPD
ncbi:MAG: GH92 family glycosyl hydrolase [Acidobacteria bacterium]|nr:GH92 family glycosyl hydrolase [Acidobacteriota bacterium]